MGPGDTVTIQEPTTEDVSTKRADVIAYIAARQGMGALFSRWVGSEPDARYLMLSGGIAYVVAIRGGEETTEDRFLVADIEHLTVRRTECLLTLEFLVEGEPRRIDLANDRLVPAVAPAFGTPPDDEERTTPLTMADQAVAYLQSLGHTDFARVA